MAASKQASKQARTYTHTLPQCSHASVGLAQARPNNMQIYAVNWSCTFREKEKKCEKATSEW